MDLRIATSLSTATNKNYLPVSHYYEYSTRYENLYEKLIQLLKRAKEIGLNPNLLHYYNEELVSKENEQDERFKNLNSEIAMILWCCQNATTLSSELIIIYNLSNNLMPLIPKEKLAKIISYLIKNYCKYEKDSSEDIFLRTLNKEEILTFNECFIAYYNYHDLSEADKRIVTFKFIEGVIQNREECAILLTLLISVYKDDVKIDMESFVLLVERCPQINHDFLRIFDAINNFQKNRINSLEYLDLLFSEYTSFQGPLIEIRKNHKIRPIPFNIKLCQVLLPLMKLHSAGSKDFIRLLAEKLALVDDSGMELATFISDYLKNSIIPDYSEIFDETYLEAVDKLPKVRNDLIHVLKQIDASKH